MFRRKMEIQDQSFGESELEIISIEIVVEFIVFLRGLYKKEKKKKKYKYRLKIKEIFIFNEQEGKIDDEIEEERLQC